MISELSPVQEPKNAAAGISPIFVLILLTYLGVGSYLLPYFQYQINPDGVSYISIAQKYLNGNFADAINGYWGPLLSWLLVPFLYFGVFHLVAPKILSLIIGMIALAGARILSRRFEMPELLRNILLFSLIPIILSLAFKITTPDLLIATVLVFYFAIIFNSNYRKNNSHGWLCGTLGSLSYFAKSYGFPFFVTHFLVFNGLHYFGAATSVDKKNVLRNFISGMVIFSILSGVWIFLISRKYDRFTFSTAASFNYGLTNGYIHEYMLVPPSNATAISYWEDPSLSPIPILPQAIGHADAKNRSDSQTRISPSAKLAYRVRDLFTNIDATISVFQAFSKFFVIVIIAGAAWLCLPFSKPILQSSVFFSMLTLAIYSGGYVLIFVEERYFEIVYFLLMPMGFYLAGLLLRLKKKLYLRAIPIALLGLFVYSCWIEPIDYLVRWKGVDRGRFEQSKKLARYDISGKVASDYRWGLTLEIAFYNNYKYYGTTGHGEGGRDVWEELQENDIDYYFVWDPKFKFGSDSKEIINDEIKGLRVYSLKENSKIQ